MNTSDLRDLVEKELRDILLGGGPPPDPLSVMYSYHMGFCDQSGNLTHTSKGKYLRSTLCLAMCAGLGGDPVKAVPAAASIEIAHRSSLIFDDIQDCGRERNGQPTVWVLWGPSQAINAGIALSCLGRLSLHRLPLPPYYVLAIDQVLEKTVIRLSLGQFGDIKLQDSGEITLSDYLQMVEGKTAALFGASCKIGVLCIDRSLPPGGETALSDFATSFGTNLGIAFQIMDDYLGVWGDEVVVGKTANDLYERKRSLPVVLAIEQDPEFTLHWLRRVHPSKIDVTSFRRWMEKRSIPDKVLGLAKRYQIRAQDDLANIFPRPTEWSESIRKLSQLNLTSLTKSGRVPLS